MNNYEKNFDKQNNYGWATTLNLSNKFPAVSKRIFDTLKDAEDYVNNYDDSAIEGLILTVVHDTEEKNGAYFVERIKESKNDSNGILTKIGSVDLTDIFFEIDSNKNNINNINNVIGEIEGEETIATIINNNKNNIETNLQLITDNKNTVDEYSVNNKKVSESPVLNTDDLLVTTNYKPGLIIENVTPSDNITDALSKIENSLASTTLAISASLNHLEHEIYGLNLKNVTWSELSQLRSMSGLTPGGKYRIIDYVTTTIKEGTSSAGHQFDLIVEALSENILSEDAKACLHEGDTYFSERNAKLGAWEIKYCLENNYNYRFDWADIQNGKGVIYYMKDEWGNEASYDFKNIKKNNRFKYDDGLGNDTSYQYKRLEL